MLIGAEIPNLGVRLVPSCPHLRTQADPTSQAEPSRGWPTPPGRPHRLKKVDQRKTERLGDMRAIQGTDKRNYAGMAQTDKLERNGAQKQLSQKINRRAGNKLQIDN